jgi:hypothetical protein
MVNMKFPLAITYGFEMVDASTAPERREEMRNGASKNLRKIPIGRILDIDQTGNSSATVSLPRDCEFNRSA